MEKVLLRELVRFKRIIISVSVLFVFFSFCKYDTYAAETGGIAVLASKAGADCICIDAYSPIFTMDKYEDGDVIYAKDNWQYIDYSAIHNSGAVLYKAKDNRKNIVVGVDAGHGTTGAAGKKAYCHPDMTPKTTGGSTAAGALKAAAQTGGMRFNDGVTEGPANLAVSKVFRDKLLEAGYDVLMLRDGEKTELDTIGRTVIANHAADCHISLHYDGDGLNYNKGAFYISAPKGIKNMFPVKYTWQEDDRLGECLVDGMRENGIKIYQKGHMAVDLSQTSYSFIPTVDVELGNQCSDRSDATLNTIADGLVDGVNTYFDK